MLINVADLALNDTVTVCFNETVELPENTGVYNKPVVSVEGIIENVAVDEFVFSGMVKTDLSLKCDLCLESFKYELSFKLSELFSNDDDDSKDAWTFSDKLIDLQPAVINGILLNMPMKSICSENCKGLCAVCGHNLNESDCGCDTSFGNPEFQKLKALFNDKEV